MKRARSVTVLPVAALAGLLGGVASGWVREVMPGKVVRAQEFRVVDRSGSVLGKSAAGKLQVGAEPSRAILSSDGLRFLREGSMAIQVCLDEKTGDPSLILWDPDHTQTFAHLGLESLPEARYAKLVLAAGPHDLPEAAPQIALTTDSRGHLDLTATRGGTVCASLVAPKAGGATLAPRSGTGGEVWRAP